MKKVILSLAVLSTLFVSCEDDKNEDIIPPIVVEVPDTYTFTRGGLSTVSYGGQTARLEMAASLMEQLNSENVIASDLLQMFNEGNWI